MGFTEEDAEAMRKRTEAGHGAIARRKAGLPSPATSSPLVAAVTFVEGIRNERKLHEAIIAHCDKQSPRWKYIHARMDKPSTIGLGAPDFVIFVPPNSEMHRRVFCIECKRKGQKPTPEQLAWHKEMEMLGHRVHVVFSMEQFLEIVK
jgi:hypothetical protein